MTEALVSATVAAIAGVAALTNRIHNRINSLHNRISEMDRRIDNFELRVASSYVSKTDLTAVLDKMEDHMTRMEEKLDRIIMRNG
tara:strand:+ start:1680 stop:1934 length:255 start_codon:yes stop_codon:yes gene_type:complete